MIETVFQYVSSVFMVPGIIKRTDKLEARYDELEEKIDIITGKVDAILSFWNIPINR